MHRGLIRCMQGHSCSWMTMFKLYTGTSRYIRVFTMGQLPNVLKKNEWPFLNQTKGPTPHNNYYTTVTTSAKMGYSSSQKKECLRQCTYYDVVWKDSMDPVLVTCACHIHYAACKLTSIFGRWGNCARCTLPLNWLILHQNNIQPKSVHCNLHKSEKLRQMGNYMEYRYCSWGEPCQLEYMASILTEKTNGKHQHPN